MAHTVRDKEKLIKRVQRLAGQVEAIKRTLVEERECGEVMLRITTVRGALDSLMAEVVEDHIREHMVDPTRHRTAAEKRAAGELIEVVRRYVR
jgi:FrmR/RcnR family transcriptional regulator, repressor of frmRAB operon